MVLVDERREDSLQRLQRTKNEIDEQKRVLKTQLQHHVGVLSENLKKPNFIRTRDKIMFTIGVANACFSPLIGRKAFFCLSDLFVCVNFSWKMATYLTHHLYHSSILFHYPSIPHLQTKTLALFR